MSGSNTIGAPPRLSGDREADTLALQQWVQSLYVNLVLVGDILTRMAVAEAKLAAIAQLVSPASPASASYSQAEATALADAIAAIISAAGNTTA